MTPDSSPRTDASTIRTTPLPPDISTLAGPQPWVIREAKARLVDLIVCYEELLEKFRAERTKSALLAKKLTSLHLHLHQQSQLVGQFTGQIECLSSDWRKLVEDLNGQNADAIGDSEDSNISDTDSDEENITFPAMEGRAFLKKYGDAEDLKDVDFGPDNQRRQDLYFGPGSPYYEAQERAWAAGTDNSST
ncbi:hypothetical protein NMY22_g7410 [Coprinellus aureogranulatus]|nr:hypothetical protein NMY22_g7410 [Coprinellus aureogranulatus]